MMGNYCFIGKWKLKFKESSIELKTEDGGDL